MIKLAWAHAGETHGTWSAWTLDPLVLAPLALAAILYARGSVRMGVHEACFAAGLGAVFFALVWPLEALGEQLFSGHMLQHLLLMNIAAPLLVLGAPLPPMFRALPNGGRRVLGRLLNRRAWRAAWRAVSGLVAATLLQQIVLWSWHTPRGIAAALESDGLHIAMHATLFAAALLFWRAVLQPKTANWWAPIVALLVTLKASGLVCIVLLLQPQSIYEAYGHSALAFGLTPAEDEQLGWGLMMVIGTATYLTAAIAASAIAFDRLEKAFPVKRT